MTYSYLNDPIRVFKARNPPRRLPRRHRRVTKLAESTRLTAAENIDPRIAARNDSMITAAVNIYGMNAHHAIKQGITYRRKYSRCI